MLGRDNIYIYIHIYIYIYIYIYICIYAYIHVRIHRRTRECTHARTHTSTYIHMHPYPHAYALTHAYMYKSIHTDSIIYMHSHIAIMTIECYRRNLYTSRAMANYGHNEKTTTNQRVEQKKNQQVRLVSLLLYIETKRWMNERGQNTTFFLFYFFSFEKNKQKYCRWFLRTTDP